MAESLDDFLKKYEGCHVLLHGEPVVLRHYSADNKVLVFDSMKNGTITLRPTSKVMESVTHFFPRRGLYNIDGLGVLFTRIANRQWKRAPCNKNAECSHIVRTFNNVFSPPGLSSTTMQQLYEPVYYSLDEALKIKDLFSCALSLEFGLTLSSKPEYDALLFFQTQAIGFVKKKTRVIHLFNKNFQQEVLDYLKSTGDHVWTLALTEM